MRWQRISPGLRAPAVCLHFVILALILALASSTSALAQGADHWVGTWATALTARAPIPPPAQNQGRGPGAPAGAPQAPLNFDNQTLRQIVHISVGGDRIRIVLSNVYGTSPLKIGAAHVSLRDKDGAIVMASDRALTFDGHGEVSVLPGAVVFSDPVILMAPALGDLAVDVYLPDSTAAGTSPLSVHNGALQTNYVSGPGNFAGLKELPSASQTQGWFFLERVEVTVPAPVGAIVGFGDSITAGARSTNDTNNRWTDVLARRLNGAIGFKAGVLNAGIAGNRMLSEGLGANALARFDRDVLTQTGATHVIVLHGINDMGARQNPASVAELIAAHQQLIERAHARGLKIIGGTITPFEGSTIENWTPEAEQVRQAFNTWIRTSKRYDGVIDFDAVLRDPDQPSKMKAQFNSGDNLHPNDAGYQAMGNAIDLALLQTVPTARTAAAARK